MEMEMEMEQVAGEAGGSRWFWAGWALAFLGFPAGGLAGLGLAGSAESVPAALLGGAATGAVVGAAQWLALRRRLPLSRWWPAATAGGMAVGLAAGVAAFGPATDGAALPLRALATGAAIGLAQLPLMARHTRRAPAWAAAVALGWPLGWVVTRAAGVDLSPGFTVFGSTGAWAFQLVTGLALAWALRGANVERRP